MCNYSHKPSFAFRREAETAFNPSLDRLLTPELSVVLKSCTFGSLELTAVFVIFFPVDSVKGSDTLQTETKGGGKKC